jgi:hypothetical protein
MDHKAFSESFEKERDALVERLLASTGGTFDIFTIYIGGRLGFYRSLAEDGPATSGELAARSGTYERYVREWLEQQTVAGILKVEDETAAAASRRYRLPAGHKEVLVDRDSPNYIEPSNVSATAGHGVAPVNPRCPRTAHGGSPRPGGRHRLRRRMVRHRHRPSLPEGTGGRL